MNPRSALVVVVCLLGVSHSADAAGLIESRVAEKKMCQLFLKKLSPLGQDSWKKLEQKADQLGRMPSLVEYADLIVASDGPLTNDDRIGLFFCFGTIQQPTVSVDHLSRLFVEQRAAISSFRATYDLKYSVRANATSEDAVTPPHLKCRFAFDGEKLYQSTTKLVDGTMLIAESEAYDGKVRRSLIERAGENPYGSIADLGKRSRFYLHGNPLACAKLVSSKLDLGAERSTTDFALLVKEGFTYETPVKVNGEDCLPVGQATHQYFCSPAHGYALVESRESEIEFDSGSRRFVRTKNSVVQTNSDFTHASGQVWLPQRSAYTQTVDNTIVEAYVMTAQSFEVNQPLEADFFVKILPDGTYLNDTLQKAAYVLGSDTENQLKGKVARTKGGFNTMVILLVNLCAAALLLSVVVVRYLRRKPG